MRRPRSELLVAVALAACAHGGARGRPAPEQPAGGGAAQAGSAEPPAPPPAGEHVIGDTGPSPPPATPRDAGAETAHPDVSPEALREALVRAAGAGMRDVGSRTAEAFRVLAALLEQAGAGDGAAAGVARLRAEASALDALEPVALEHAERIKAGLAAGTAALRALAEAHGRAELLPWVTAAGRAVDAIDAAIPDGLQRARIQDALRAVADAALLVAAPTSR